MIAAIDDTDYARHARRHASPSRVIFGLSAAISDDDVIDAADY